MGKAPEDVANAIRFPAPLHTPGRRPAHPYGTSDGPWLRWAARCDSSQFGPDGQVGFHAHDEPELVFCTAGRIVIEVAGEHLAGTPGNLYVLPPIIPHAVRSEGDWENICVLFSGGAAILQANARVIALGEEKHAASWFLDLCDLHDGRPRMPGPVADSLLRALLLRIAEIESEELALRDLHPRLAGAIDLIHDNADRNLASEDFAAATFTSYSHLAALFRARFGCGPLTYHRRHRMERAKALLADPYVSVAEVASRVGYEDTNYFVRVFRKTVGISPHRWRNGRVGIEHRTA
jgi:AraC-like DNA-binding protein